MIANLGTDIAISIDRNQSGNPLFKFVLLHEGIYKIDVIDIILLEKCKREKYQRYSIK